MIILIENFTENKEDNSKAPNQYFGPMAQNSMIKAVVIGSY